jgi:hypothetical protein
MNNFKEFVDKKGREALRQLKILQKLLEQKKLRVQNFLEEDDPYIFVSSPSKNLSFDGIRIYKIGDDLAFRVQKEATTHPYGKAYLLDVEDMFNDLISDKKDEEAAGKEVVEAVAEQIVDFFKKSEKAEKELRSSEIDQAKEPKTIGSTTGTNYSSLIYSNG